MSKTNVSFVGDPFTSEASKFVSYRTYRKYREDKGRRETWAETVQRYIDFITEERGHLIPEKILQQIHQYIFELKTMPSMRALWSAGEAAKQDNVCMYNCSHIAIDDIAAFGEILYILMQGTGVGFSVDRKYIDKLPTVLRQSGDGDGVFQIPDSKLGWKQSIDVLFRALFAGKDIEFDYSLIRQRGSKLRTFGGRASGPEPLKELHKFIKQTLLSAQRRKLTSLECHDIICKLAEIVVSGGVRRSSLISISDLDDKEMRDAKQWETLEKNPHRYLSNNSAVYYTKPTVVQFLDEWTSLAKSGSGERGICNVSNLEKLSKRRNFKDHDLRFNPCAEILLRASGQFCNLSEVVLREDDDIDSFLEKVKIATWIGVIQSTFTHFPNLRSQWKQNCDEEHLLGVSITGQMDNPKLLTPEKLEMAKKYAIKVMKKACRQLEISESTAVTCVKPSGTVSQKVGSASGMHLRHSKFQIRRYRISSMDPLAKVLKDSGFDLRPDNGQDEETATTLVVSFPLKAPKDALTRNDMTAIEQLEWYKKVQTNWAEHNVSCTVYVKDHEWLQVGSWVYDNWEHFVGISFLPFDGGKYQQAPNEEITEEQYNDMVAKLPKIDYSLLEKYEKEDMTEGESMLACTSGSCEL